MLALVYVVLAAGYISLSGIAARAASGGDVAQLERIELWKGIAFVVVTALIAFAATRFFLKRIAQHRAALGAAHMALLETEHKAAAGMLAATVAHDLNNILMILDAGVEELDELCETKVIDPELVSDMRAGLRQARSLSKRLSKAATEVSSSAPESVALGVLVREAVELSGRHRAARHCAIEVETPEELTLEVRPALVQQVVSNLVINAAEAAEGCTIQVVVSPLEEGARIEVHDSGPGVPEEERDRVFAPFYTSKETGTGLGLMSVRLCAALHGGDASVTTSSRLGGACFSVDLRRVASGETSSGLVGGWEIPRGPDDSFF